MQWFQAIPAEDLWEGELRSIQLGTTPILLLRLHGTIVAYLDRCPHLGVPLSDGNLQGDILTCCAHHWQFNVHNGEGINPIGKHLTSLPIKIEKENIFVALNIQGGNS